MERIKSKVEQVISMSSYVHRLVGRLLWGNPDCEDIAQNILLKLLNNPELIPVKVSNAWVYAVASNAVHDSYKALKREARYVDRNVTTDAVRFVFECDDWPLYSADCLRTQLTSSEPDLIPQIERFFDGLSDSHRQVLTLFLQGRSYAQIAELTETSIGTVRSRLHYARKKAQAKFASYL